MQKLQNKNVIRLAALALFALAPTVSFAQEGGLDPSCDASGFTPEMGQLLNAEPKPGVVTVSRASRQPGEIGPYAAPALGLLGQGMLLLGTVGVGFTGFRRRRFTA